MRSLSLALLSMGIVFLVLALTSPIQPAVYADLQAVDASPATSLSPSPSQTTPTATPGLDITLTGRVYDAAGGPNQGIAGANVSVTSCFPRAFAAVTGPDGAYTLFLPGSYFTCTQVSIIVSAAGYQAFQQTIATEELRRQPTRDFALASLTPTPPPTVTRAPTLMPSITQTPNPTSTPTPTLTPTPTMTPFVCDPTVAGHVCNGILVVRAYIDFRCDGYFNRGTDWPLAGATITGRLPDGTTRMLVVEEHGSAVMNAVNLPAGQGLAVRVDDVPRPTWVAQDGLNLVPCANTEAQLTRAHFGPLNVAFVDFRYTIAP